MEYRNIRTGDIAHKHNDKCYTIKNGSHIIPRRFIEDSMDWQLEKEKDIPKDFKVGTRVMDTWYSNCIYTKNDMGLWSCGNLDNFNIHHWEIGDGCRFKLFEPYKPKVPLFTTADGKDCYTEDNFIVHFVSKDWQITSTTPYYAIHTTGYSKIFFDKEKAKEYILLNKPIEVSYADIRKVLNERSSVSPDVYKRLQEFFKNKINP